MADFITSTHRKKWLLSIQDLVENCRAANQRAVEALQKYGATRVECQPDGTLAYPGAPAQGDNGHRSLPEPLTLAEEFVIRRFYEQKIQQVSAAFSFPNKIQATAILYFKRFYQKWSVMEHDPKHIMLTCIYLSCKVEEFHVSADELGKGIQQDPQVVLKNELTVLQGLDFELIVYTPYRSVDGFIYDLEVTTSGKKVILQELKLAAQFVVDSMMLTDVPLLFPPGQVALAALRTANQEEPKVDFNRYLQNMPERQKQRHSHAELIHVLDSIDLLVKDAKQPVESDVRRIDRKLKYCRNPGLQDEGKGKRERKEKQRHKRGSHDVQMVNAVDNHPLDLNEIHSVKRGQSEGDAML
ncbi:unnamed protein product [Sphagnum jensenii]|uniref:Cyclin-like domain-containing protein n=1 Tax=Sphagnum jensenii TaxID=128206 RepID=A0ABP1BK94_9BRYO